MHEVGACEKYLLRNAFCITSPFWGLFGSLIVSDEIAKSHRDDTFGKRSIYPYDIVIQRSKDQRICPSNFNIQEDVDPLTQEEFSLQKLQSPQVIYLPNYVTDAKAFILAILRAGKKEFIDPFCRREFSTEERQAIVSQILAIFQISEEELNRCFEIGEKMEMVSDAIDSHRYQRDTRALDERGRFTEHARATLEYCFNDLEDPTLPEIDQLVDQGIEQLVSQIKESIFRNSPFQSLLRLGLSMDLLLNQFLNVTGVLLIPIGSVVFPIEVNLTPFLMLHFLKDVLPPEKLEKINSSIDQIKENLRRFIRSEILERTGFNKELRGDDRAQYRIEDFERVTGVSLRKLSVED